MRAPAPPPLPAPRVAPPAFDLAGSPDESARRWARQAFDVGLRDCPKVTPRFEAACRAQMAEEVRLAQAAAAARAEFAAAFDHQPVYVPEPRVDPEPAPLPAARRSIRGAAVQIMAEREDGDAEQRDQHLVRRMAHGEGAGHDAEPDPADRRGQGIAVFE